MAQFEPKCLALTDRNHWHKSIRDIQVDMIMNPPELQGNFEEALELWRKIALFETIDYFEHSVRSTMDVEYTTGEKTCNVLKDLLLDYSVSQVYGIIYKTTNNALRFQAEKAIRNRHAANTIISNAQSFGERAKINKWKLQSYHRIKNCPESALSKFFFERILKIGSDGFYGFKY